MSALIGKLEKLHSEQMKKGLPRFKAGDTVRVHQLIQEGNKERVQVFEGVVICRNGGGIDETVTVRKVSHNVGVERVFPVHSPRVKEFEVKQRGRVRRARIYYLRELRGKAARIREERYVPTEEEKAKSKKKSGKKNKNKAEAAQAS